MPCYHPLHGWRSRKATAKGKYAVVFDVKQGFRDKPITVPCGQCIGCRLERSRQWAIRCVHESKMHAQNCFITLTYTDEDLKKKIIDAHGEIKGLDKSDFQKFMKRLRKKIGAVRYFHAGEYGDKTGRPHYHACLFGYDFPDKKIYSENKGNRLYTSSMLDKIWQHGKCWIGEVTFESAAYVARYIMKKITGVKADDYYCGLTPEYTTMSLKPSIGATWLQKYKSDVYPSDEVIVRGRAMRPPRAYDKKLELIDPTLYAKLKRVRKAAAKPQSDERLEIAEVVKKASISLLKRNL